MASRALGHLALQTDPRHGTRLLTVARTAVDIRTAHVRENAVCNACCHQNSTDPPHSFNHGLQSPMAMHFCQHAGNISEARCVSPMFDRQPRR